LPESIGIDDGSSAGQREGADDSAVADAARQLGELYPAIDLALHRRDGKRHPLVAASRALLQHLTLTGPVQVGELARRLERAQSVVSEIVAHLEPGRGPEAPEIGGGSLAT